MAAACRMGTGEKLWDGKSVSIFVSQKESAWVMQIDFWPL
jgi:hypothetical protein